MLGTQVYGDKCFVKGAHRQKGKSILVEKPQPFSKEKLHNYTQWDYYTHIMKVKTHGEEEWPFASWNIL